MDYMWGLERMHYHHNGGTKRSVYILKYVAADYPLSSWKNTLQPDCESGKLPLTFLGEYVIFSAL